MARNPDHYAIVVGIDGYPQLLPLRSANQDATFFAKWLQKENGGGLDPNNIELIISPPKLPPDPFDAQPVAAKIDRALTRFGFEKGGRIGSRLYFYFAGHGFGPEFDNVGMLMATAAMQRLKDNVGLRDFRTFFRQSEAFDEVVFFLDCCRDPIGGIQTFGPKIDLPAPRAGVSVRDVVVMAAQYGEKAFEPVLDQETHERRGILTKAILEGLTEPAAADGLGRFTKSSLFRYVTDRVRDLSDDVKLKQSPEVDDPKPDQELVFSTIPHSELSWLKVRISASPAYQGELILMDDKSLPIISQPAAGLTKENPWELTLLRNRWYSLTHKQNGVLSKPQILSLEQAPDPYEFTYE